MIEQIWVGKTSAPPWVWKLAG